MYPNHAMGYAYLGSCKLFTGNAEQDLVMERRAMELNPRDPNLFLRYRRLGLASLLLGRDQEAIAFLEHSLVVQGDYEGTRQTVYRQLAAAYALVGRSDDAKRALAEADRLWPFDTVRSHVPGDTSDSRAVEQIRHYQDGLRLAGERDHADEDADFGVTAEAGLHGSQAGRTPKRAPGATTIRTADVPGLLATLHPVVIDVGNYAWGRSVPGAVELRYAGLGGSFADMAQQRLGRKMQALTKADRAAPIIVVGWNCERFDGYNLTLRLVALGYTQVYWYRGGREAWEVAGLPETEMTPQDW